MKAEIAKGKGRSEYKCSILTREIGLSILSIGADAPMHHPDNNRPNLKSHVGRHKDEIILALCQQLPESGVKKGDG